MNREALDHGLTPEQLAERKWREKVAMSADPLDIYTHLTDIRSKACRHTKQPAGYLAWHEWADKKSHRHYQVRCDHCGLFAIWKRKC